MGGKIQIEIPQEKIAAFCRKWKVREFSLFGSVLREDFKPGSDVDILVRFAPDAKKNLDDLMTMQDEITEILGRKVDLVERELVEKSPNYIRRKHILSHLEPFYVEG